MTNFLILLILLAVGASLLVGYLNFWPVAARILARPAVADWLISRAMRTPYSPIIKDGVLYMDRFWLFNPYPDTGGSGADRPRWQFPISIRIHHIVMPDQDRDLHDHPWNARTVILRGGYCEERKVERRPWNRGSIAEWEATKGFRSPSEPAHVDYLVRSTGETATLSFGEFHRITSIPPGGAWTMFITGKYRGTWGFDVDGVKVQWRKYLGLEE